MPPAFPSSTDGPDDSGTHPDDEPRRFSRRQVLTAAGASGVLGGVAGAVLGARFDASLGATGKCDSTPLSTARHPWPYPEADAACTGHVPERQMPASLDPGWSVNHEFDQVHAPLVADEMVLLPEQWDSDRGSRFVAFDPEDGAERWRTGYRPYHPETANIAGGLVFALREDGLGALALGDGTDRWQAGGTSEQGSRILRPGPVAAGGHVVTLGSGDDGPRFETYDARTGDRCGTTATDYEKLFGPAMSGTQAIFIGSPHSTLRAFSLENWSPNWTRSFDGTALDLPRVAGGVVYTGGGGLLVALDPADGSTLWSREFPSRSRDDAERPISSIVAVTPDAIVALGPDPDADAGGLGPDRDGITAFSRVDGSTLWHRDPGQDGAYRYRYSSITAAGDALYAAFFDGEADEYRLIELVTATGELRDSATLHVETPFEVVTGDGRLYVVGDSGIESRGG